MSPLTRRQSFVPSLPAAPTVAVDSAVPVGRIGYDLSADLLLLHAFVAPEAWNSLREDGSLRCGDEHVDPVDDYAYRWMRRQLAARTGVDAWPLWLWAKTTRADLVAAARKYARNAPGTVLMTCRIPRARALLSHFGDWHCALNGAPVLPWTSSDEAFDAALDHWYARVDDQGPTRPPTAPSTRLASGLAGRAGSLVAADS